MDGLSVTHHWQWLKGFLPEENLCMFTMFGCTTAPQQRPITDCDGPLIIHRP